MNEIKTKLTGASAPIPKGAPAFQRPFVIEEPQVGAKPGTQEDSHRSADGAQDSVPPAPPLMTDALDLPNEAASSPTQTRQEALRRYEGIIEQSLAREDERDAALLVIHDEKLYKLTHASFGEYLEQRWGRSRSRGYQLVHLARLKRCRLLNGQPPPLNERQARQFTADGTRLPQQPGENSYERRLCRVTRYLAANLANSPPGERRRFLQDVRKALHHLDRDPDIQLPPHSQGAAFVETEPPGRPWSAAAKPRTPQPADRPVSAPPPHPQEVGATAEVKGCGQPASSVTTKASPATGLQSNPQPAGGTAQERPCPRGNAGSLLGLTMEQARRFGYCRK
jgi:hypothetical protein